MRRELEEGSKQEVEEGPVLSSPGLSVLYLPVYMFSSSFDRLCMTCDCRWEYTPVSNFGNGHTVGVEGKG